MAASRFSILHIVECYGGGVATFLHYLLPAQVRQGHKVRFICSPRSGVEGHAALDDLRRAGVDVRVVPMGRGLRPWLDFSAWRAIRRLASSMEVDVIHTHGFKAGVLGRLIGLARGRAATVHTPHCLAFMRCACGPVRWGSRMIERKLARRSDALMFVSKSEFQCGQIYGILPPGGGRIIPNGLPPLDKPSPAVLAALRRELCIPPGVHVVGTCCRLVAYKGVDQFIRCAYTMLARDPSLIFIVLGEGPDRARIEAAVAAKGLEGSVRLVGHRADGLAVISMMDVLALCSKAEGMPYSILEALALGVPVVASEVPGNRDIIYDGSTGLLYRYGDVNDLESRIRSCLDDEKLRERLISGGRKQVAAAHRLDQQVDAVLDLYEQAVVAARGRLGSKPVVAAWDHGLEVGR